MPTPDEGLKAQRALSGWSATRTTAGVLAIVMTVVGVIEAVLALRNGAALLPVLKGPAAFALLVVYVLLRSNRHVRQLRDALNQ